MLTKYCQCGIKIPQTQSKCAKCKQDRAENNKYYDKNYRKNKEVYHNKTWETLTKLCKNKYNGLDVYAFYKYNKIIKGTLSHHIVEVEEDLSKAYNLNNLIYVSDKSHKEIHKIYRSNEQAKKELQKILLIYIHNWGAGDI